MKILIDILLMLFNKNCLLKIIGHPREKVLTSEAKKHRYRDQYQKRLKNNNNVLLEFYIFLKWWKNRQWFGKEAPDIYWQRDQKTLALSAHQENDLSNVTN